MTSLRLPRRGALAGSAVLLVGASFGPARAAPVGPWAVELFTSQGCSSCPPADRVLGGLARRDDIVALSFHVNYWDYIGWKDPFASAPLTERQRSYARMLKQRYVYTPEMVVDGIETTLPLFRTLVRNADIQNGVYDIHWLEKFLAEGGMRESA